MKWFFKDVRKACGKRWWKCSGSELDSRARWLGLTYQFCFLSVWLWVRSLTSLHFSLIHGNNNLQHGWLSCQSQRAWGGGDCAACIKWSWDAAAHSSRAGPGHMVLLPNPQVVKKLNGREIFGEQHGGHHLQGSIWCISLEASCVCIHMYVLRSLISMCNSLLCL